MAAEAAHVRRRRSERGLTLVELLIVIGLIAILAGSVMMGPGLLQGSRLKSAATLIALDPGGNSYRFLPLPQGRYLRVKNPKEGTWQIFMDPAGGSSAWRSRTS